MKKEVRVTAVLFAPEPAIFDENNKKSDVTCPKQFIPLVKLQLPILHKSLFRLGENGGKAQIIDSCVTLL